MDVVGEAADWPTTLAQIATTCPDMLLIDWSILPVGAYLALGEIRGLCPSPIKIVLISHLNTRQQAALSAGADAFINRSEMPDRVAEHLRVAARSLRLQQKQSKLVGYNMHAST
jgi:DNA-binding NarL/FixJ family response regulator